MVSFLFMMTVRALVTDAGEVVVVSQFLQSQLCRQLGVEVADPRLGQRGDLLGGGDGQVLAGEGDHTVRLTGVVQHTRSEVHAPPVRLHLGVTDLEPVDIEPAQDLHEGVEGRRVLT